MRPRRGRRRQADHPTPTTATTGNGASKVTRKRRRTDAVQGKTLAAAVVAAFGHVGVRRSLCPRRRLQLLPPQPPQHPPRAHATRAVRRSHGPAASTAAADPPPRDASALAEMKRQARALKTPLARGSRLWLTATGREIRHGACILKYRSQTRKAAPRIRITRTATLLQTGVPDVMRCFPGGGSESLHRGQAAGHRPWPGGCSEVPHRWPSP